MRKYLLFFALLAGLTSARAQQLPITVIVDQDHQQSGTIDFYKVGNRKKSVTIQTANGDETFPTTDIYGFRLTLENGEQEEYRSAIVSYDDRSRPYGDVKVYDQFLITDTVFLKVLVTGEISLLHMKTKNGKDRFFFQKVDENPEYLVQQEYLSNNGDVNQVRTTDQYKKQLLSQFKSCTSLDANHVYNCSYTEKSLKKLFIQYNQCTNSLERKAPATKRMETHAKFFAGTATAKLNIGFNADYFQDIEFTRTTSFAAGAGVEFFPLKRNKRVALAVDFLGSRFSASSDSLISYGVNERYVYLYNFEMTRLKLNLSFQYHFVKNATFDVYASAGISNGLNIISENKGDLWLTMFGNTTHNDGEAIEKPRKHEQALIFGAGVFYNRLGLQLLHERSNGFSPTSSITTSINTNYLLLTFRL